MASQANPDDANHGLANNGLLGASTSSLGLREAARGTQAGAESGVSYDNIMSAIGGI